MTDRNLADARCLLGAEAIPARAEDLRSWRSGECRSRREVSPAFGSGGSRSSVPAAMRRASLNRAERRHAMGKFDNAHEFVRSCAERTIADCILAAQAVSGNEQRNLPVESGA